MVLIYAVGGERVQVGKVETGDLGEESKACRRREYMGFCLLGIITWTIFWKVMIRRD